MTDSPPARPVLAEFLAELGWRPETLARRLNALAAANGRQEHLHEKTPYKWLRGERPRTPWPGLIAALLTEGLCREVTAADLGWPGEELECVSASTGLVLPWTAAGSLRALHAVAHAGGVDRRLFLTLTGAAVTAPAHEWLLANGTGDVARPGNGALPAEVVDHLDTITARLRRMDDQLGGASLLNLIRGQLRYVVNVIENHRYPETVGRRLHATAAELLRLAGWSCFDAGGHAQTQRYWVAALHAAHSAGDRALGANILGFMCCQAMDLGQIRESVNLAETARAGYPGAAPRVGAILDLWAAGAHARERGVMDCRRDLDAMFDRLGNTPPSSGEPGWSYWLDEAQAHAGAGDCFLRLRDWSRARSHLRSALRLHGAGFAREATLTRIRLADTYLRQDQPDIDQALAVGAHAVNALVGTINSARLVKHLTPLVDGLAPYRRRPAVREFIDRAAELQRAAA